MNDKIKLLSWYKDIGIDIMLSADTTDRFITKQHKKIVYAPSDSPPLNKIINNVEENLLKPIESLHKDLEHNTKKSIMNLEALRKKIENFEGCAIKKLAKNTVFADGNSTSPLMLIGEAPGANEDEQGIPFCGASGHLLNLMLEAIGYPRSTIYITNIVFWRPPGNRPPTDEEIGLCMPFVRKHIDLICPKLIVLLGSTACKAILETKLPMMKLRGKLYDYKELSNEKIDFNSEKNIKIIATFHPSYLLRQPSQKKLAWHDMLMAKHYLKSILKPVDKSVDNT